MAAGPGGQKLLSTCMCRCGVYMHHGGNVEVTEQLSVGSLSFYLSEAESLLLFLLTVPCTPGWLLDYPPVSVSPLFTGLLVLKVHDHIQIFTWILGFNLGGWACVAIAFTC